MLTNSSPQLAPLASPSGCAIDAPFALENARTPTLHEQYFGRCAVRIAQHWQKPGSPALPRLRLSLAPQAPMNAAAVEELRNLQVALWYSGWKVQDTGQWDAATQGAVKELQKAYGISPIDGALNARTRFVINSLIEGKDPFRELREAKARLAQAGRLAPPPAVAPAAEPVPAPVRAMPPASTAVTDALEEVRDTLAQYMPNLFRRKLPAEIPVEVEIPPGPPPRPRYVACAVANAGVQWLDPQEKLLCRLPQRKPGMGGYAMSETILEQTLIAAMLDLLHQVAPLTASLGGPDRGRYAGQGYAGILAAATGEQVVEFLGFVALYPRKYVGKPLKFGNAFVAWLRAGAVTT